DNRGSASVIGVYRRYLARLLKQLFRGPVYKTREVCRMWSRREIMKLFAGLPFAAMAGCAAGPVQGPPVVKVGRGLRYKEEGKTSFGTWQTDVTCTPSQWRPGAAIDLLMSLALSPDMLPNLGRAVGTP